MLRCTNIYVISIPWIIRYVSCNADVVKNAQSSLKYNKIHLVDVFFNVIIIGDSSSEIASVNK